MNIKTGWSHVAVFIYIKVDKKKKDNETYEVLSNGILLLLLIRNESLSSCHPPVHTFYFFSIIIMIIRETKSHLYIYVKRCGDNEIYFDMRNINNLFSLEKKLVENKKIA